jgi:hypothetical protein
MPYCFADTPRLLMPAIIDAEILILRLSPYYGLRDYS